MNVSPVTLVGKRVQLEPMTLEHLPAMMALVAEADLWRWIPWPMKTESDLRGFMQAVLAQQAAGTAMPWVTRELATDRIVGCTRFSDIQKDHKTLELGGTVLLRDCQGTGLNVEAKYLQLRHAFETMGAMRVALKTHHENLRSQSAMRAMGAKEEGTFRNHMLMPDGSVRHSVWFSVIREEWPQTKAHLEARMARFFSE